MARRNAPNYSVSILDRLTQRAEARVERVRQVRELGGLPPQPEPSYQPLWSPNYEYMNGEVHNLNGLAFQVGYNRTRADAARGFQEELAAHAREVLRRRTMQSIWDDIDLAISDSDLDVRTSHEHAYAHLFGRPTPYQPGPSAEDLRETLLKTFNLESVRKMRLAEKEGLTNKDAQFLLDKDND